MKEYKIPYSGEYGAQTFTRKSDRVYTHIVVGTDYTEPSFLRGDQEIPARVFPGVALLGYAGNPKLAQKRAATWEAKRYSKVEIVEITPDMVREINPRAKKDI